MAFEYPSTITARKEKEKKAKAKAKKNIETKSGDMVQPDPDILSKRFDKKFKKYALSKESQLHAKDYDDGIDKGEARAMKEVIQEAGIKMPKFSKGGRIGLKHGSYETVPPSKGFSEYVTKEKQKKIDEANKKANEKDKPGGLGPMGRAGNRKEAKSGGRINLKGGGCATKGKGKAYGKNS